jgi:hypothetical protein
VEGPGFCGRLAKGRLGSLPYVPAARGRGHVWATTTAVAAAACALQVSQQWVWAGASISAVVAAAARDDPQPTCSARQGGEVVVGLICRRGDGGCRGVPIVGAAAEGQAQPRADRQGGACIEDDWHEDLCFKGHGVVAAETRRPG